MGAGVVLDQLNAFLRPQGFCFGPDVATSSRATIGGMLATNDSGSLRVRFGALRDLIIGATIVLPDGTVAKSGGKVVKNVAGYDLQKLMTGSFGTLGIITQATFRLYPISKQVRTFSTRFTDAENADRFALRLLDSQLTYTGIQLRAEDRQFHIDVRLEGAVEAPGRPVLFEWKGDEPDRATQSRGAPATRQPIVRGHGQGCVAARVRKG